MIPLERLVKLALDELAESEAVEVEEHVLACGSCASALERLLKIGDAVGDLVRRGKISFPVSGALLAELEKAGLVSRSYHLAPDQIVPCAVAAEDLFALTTLEVDLRDVEQVDVVRTIFGQSLRIADVPFDAERGLVRFVTRSDVLRTLPTARIQLEVFSVRASGERKLSEHFLDHTGFTA